MCIFEKYFNQFAGEEQDQSSGTSELLSAWERSGGTFSGGEAVHCQMHQTVVDNPRRRLRTLYINTKAIAYGIVICHSIWNSIIER